MQNLKIKTKLFLLFLIPIIFICFLSYDILYNKYLKSKTADKVNITTIFSVKISNLIHELQKERGMGSAYLSSNGKEFKDKLLKQRKLTDNEHNKLENYYNLNKQSIFNKTAMKKLDIFLNNHEVFLKNREQTISLNISKDYLIGYYSAINEMLLDTIYDTYKQLKEVVDIRDVLAYRNFLYAKEQTGIVRAELTSVFFKDEISEYENLHILEPINSQKIYMKNFFKLAPNTIKNIYYSVIDSEILDEVQAMERLITEGLIKEDFDINGYYWFDTITKKIENLKIVEDEFAKYMINNTTNRAKQLNDEIIWFISLGLLIIFIIFAFTAKTVANINNSLGKIISGILSISNTNKYKPIKISEENELGDIANTLNNMVDSLNEKDKKNQEQREELLREKENATQSAKAKSEFLANMSHEIRTPLSAILGFIDLLKEEERGEKSSKYIEIIDSSSKNLLHIIEDILDFSKIESGKLDIDKVDFIAKTEFEVITHLFSAKCSQKDISLYLDLDKNLPKVINTDPLRIKQIILNLISNAIKFTRSGKNITVKINYKNNLLNVTVNDEGKGIAKDKLSHIFESFSQEDSSTTREYGGTGLGLSISSELVKLLGGELKVKSEVGIGSEFYFSIPADIGEDIKELEELHKNITFEDKKILLVEDNKANQMFMKIIIKKLKMEFDIASDGLEAIEKFKQNIYDVILMDENMPNLNGIEATKQILKIEVQKNLFHTPIIALTANALKGDREKFLAAGMDEYLTKPINKQKLSKILNKFLY